MRARTTSASPRASPASRPRSRERGSNPRPELYKSPALPTELPRRCLKATRWLRVPRPWDLDDRSVLEDRAPNDLVAALEAVLLRAERVRLVVPRHDDVVELPDRAVLLHAGDRVVDVQLALHPRGLAAQLPLRVERDLVDDLVLLRDLHLLRIDVELALLAREHDLAIPPDPLDLVSVRVVVVDVLPMPDRLRTRRHRSRLAAAQLPDALFLGRLGLGHDQSSVFGVVFLPVFLAAVLRGTFGAAGTGATAASGSTSPSSASRSSTSSSIGSSSCAGASTSSVSIASPSSSSGVSPSSSVSPAIAASAGGGGGVCVPGAAATRRRCRSAS